MEQAAARHVGARILGEVEEESLEELLNSLRTTFKPDIGALSLPIPELSSLISRYQKSTQSAPPPLLSVTGRYLPLIYHLISTLISEPHNYSVVVIDCETRFDVTRLVGTSDAYTAKSQDLTHIYIFRPARGHSAIKAAISAAEDYMIYGSHRSRGRKWWGTAVVGNTGGDVNAGWKGWLRVDREAVGNFEVGLSVEEALRERNRRQSVVEAAGWLGSCRWGQYTWKAE